MVARRALLLPMKLKNLPVKALVVARLEPFHASRPMSNVHHQSNVLLLCMALHIAGAVPSSGRAQRRPRPRIVVRGLATLMLISPTHLHPTSSTLINLVPSCILKPNGM